MKKSQRFILGGVLLVSLTAAACTRGTPAGEQKSRGPVIFALSGNPNTLDPHATSETLTFQVAKSFYDSLLEPDANGVIVPALAESYTVSPDGLVWTFKLRPNVYFHNGDLLSSADVKATFDRVRFYEDYAPKPSPKAIEFGPITQIDTPDSLTVVITLSGPFAPFIATLASGWGAIMPESLIKSGHDFTTKPVGTGPYIFQEWIRDGRILTKKNDRYWMPGLPRAEAVTFNIITEQAVAVQGLKSGQVDYVYSLMQDNISLLEGDPGVSLERNLGATILVMSINCSTPGLDDLRLRQAVNMAIDKQKVLDVVYGGGKITGTFLDPENAFYRDFTSLYPFNPDRARELVAQVGDAAKREFLMVLPQNYETHIRAGEIYQEMLANVGIKTRIQMVDWSTWMSDVFNSRTGGKYDFTVIGHTGKLDPDGTLGGYGDPARYTRWDNPECLELVTRAKFVTDPAERRALYDRAQELLAIEVPFMFLGSAWTTNACRSDISGIIMTPKLDTFDFRYLEFK